MPSVSRQHCLLVVDDEPDVVQSIQDLLRFDFRVLGTTRVAEGLRIMDEEDVDIVMTDQRMPGMSGVEFLKRIKETHPRAVRLLFTAYSDIETVTDAINEGNVYRYISKPFDPHELRVILHQAGEHFDLQMERDQLMREVQEKNRQLEAANEELRRADQLKTSFMRVASHEFRTPLTVILGLAELADRSPEITPSLKAWIEQIHASGIRLNQRVDLMLKLLVAERFERRLERRDVDVASLVRKAAEAVTGFVAQRRQTLAVTLDDDVGKLAVEEGKIHDAIVQLLVNAVKFSPDEGTIHLGARRTGAGTVVISVADRGLGIDQESLPHIFEPFFTRFDVLNHCSGTFEFNRRGLGLGLSVVKTFVEMHGGTVTVHSELGQGTTFTITLPARRSIAWQ